MAKHEAESEKRAKLTMTDHATGTSVEAVVTGQDPQSSFAARVLLRAALIREQGGTVSDSLTVEIIDMDGERQKE